MRFYKIVLYVLVSFFHHISFPFVSTTLDGAPTATVYDKRSGKWIIGIDSSAADSDLICCINPIDGSNTLSMTSLKKSIGTEAVTHLALSYAANSSDTWVLYTLDESPNPIRCFSLNDNLEEIQASLFDTANASGEIISLTASSDHVFGAVKDIATNNFGLGNSGIAKAMIDHENQTLTTTNNTTLPINKDCEYIKGSAPTGKEPELRGDVTLHWCEGLERLYIGFNGKAQQDDANSGEIRALVITDANLSTPQPVFGANHTEPFKNCSSNGTCNIVGASETEREIEWNIHHIDTLKTVNNNYYLIVHGGRYEVIIEDDIADVDVMHENKIFALPLVSSGDNKGSLAKVTNRTTGAVDFTHIADNNTQLYVATDEPALVGRAGLPFDPIQGSINQMSVVGDTVFCTVTMTEEGGEHYGGIYYSQAIYNEDCSIRTWTFWTKAVPNEVSGTARDEGESRFFAIDPVHGKILIIPTNDSTTVNATQWTYSQDTNTIEGSANILLQGPCYSHLHLHRHVKNYGNSQSSRFVFLGGHNKVVAIKTSYRGDTAYERFENSPTLDWTTPQRKTTQISQGLENVGAITAIGWANQGQNNDFNHNYLFAGTNQGLYTYVSVEGQTGINRMSAMDTEPFNGTYSWKKINALKNDPVHRIISNQRNNIPVTLVITHGITHKLWRLQPYQQNTLSDLNATAELMWEGQPISANSQTEPTFFYDIFTISSGDYGEFMYIVTNLGIYKISNETDNIEDITFSLFRNIDLNPPVYTSVYTPKHGLFEVQNMYYCASLYPDQSFLPTNSILGQINFSNTLGNSERVVSGIRISEDNSIISYAPYTHSFYTNGAFRFLTTRNLSSDTNGYTLATIPYNNGNTYYNVNSLYTINDTPMKGIKTVYWIDEVDLGYHMIGTDLGVICLR